MKKNNLSILALVLVLVGTIVFVACSSEVADYPNVVSKNQN